MMIPHTRRLAIVPAVLAVLAFLAGGGIGSGSGAASPLTDLTLPPGFELRVFASNVDVARFLTYSPAGDLYVGELLGHQGALTILPDRNHDGVADRAIQLGTDLYSPNNVSFRPVGFGTVFAVGAIDRVKVYTDTKGDLSFAQSAVLVDNLPSDGRHKTKTVAYGPDGLLYVSVGSFDDDPPGPDARAGIWRYNADGTGQHKLAGGLRNTVGCAWDPVGGGMWGADNGSDDVSRDEPHDELNLLVDGGNYGWPNCIDQGVHNDKTDPFDCSKTLAPTTLFDPHGAPLGIAFYSGASFPQQYWGGLFAADHSIQYTEQRGVYFVPFKNGSPSGPPQLFLQQSQSSGTTNRFLGLAVNPYDGSLMVSDDREGRIYQVRYTGALPTLTPAPRPTAVPGKPQPVTAAPLLGFARFFAPTTHRLNGAFLQFWFWNGGLARYGYPISEPLQEQGADGKILLVQYTERARLEYHPENRGSPYEVLLGRLGAEGVAGRTDAPFQPAPAQAGAVYVTETKHNLSGPIAAYWQRNGGVPVFGYPLSEAFMEKNPADGKTYLVQYFERNRLEYHPEYQGTDSAILLGLLGVQSYTQRYGAPVLAPAP
jgi:glucose/arabinose dehydrogenase